MPEPGMLTSLLAVAGPVLAVVNLLLIRARTNQEAAEKLAAVSAKIQEALDTTEAYLLHRANRGEARPAEEEEIARRWRVAASALREVARSNKDVDEIADRMSRKAQAWTYPDQWPAERIKAARIDFATISSSLSELKDVSSLTRG